MTTTTKQKPRVQKPPAEVVGSFADWLKRGVCDDGRDLWVFDDTGDSRGNHRFETFVLAASELLAWKALHSQLGIFEKMTKAKLAERTTQFARQLMEAQTNGETQKDVEEC